MDARLLEANRLLLQKQPQLAEVVCRQVLSDRPRDPQALAMLGSLQHKRGDWAGALASFETAVQSQPGSAVLRNLQALTLQKLDRFGEAEAAWREALALQPESGETLMNLGVALHHQQRFGESLQMLDRALALRPDSLDIQLNRANALMELDRFDEAMAALALVRAAQPSDVPLLMNIANALRDQHRFDEALATYAEALALRPEDPGLRWNRSLCLLTSGDLAQGWAEYEWRWKAPRLGNVTRKFDAPKWLGREPVAGKTVLIHPEQGLGDSIQMARYARVLAGRGAKVILQVQKALLPLLRNTAGAAKVIAPDEDPGPIDFHCPMFSLPLAVGTVHETVPSPLGIFSADPALVAKWRETLAGGSGPNVGLVWSGNPGYADDHRRSLALSAFRAALPPGPRYWCLKKDVVPSDEAALHEDPPIRRFDQNDFIHTAAQISALDLVISVDTSVMHLAGTLGTPTWIVLSFKADFRWGTATESTPWYPGARIFRQKKPGEWGPVLAEIRDALANFPR
ncbi:MAG: tetratricopeptide repeat protein [Ramlibacter sp.]|nr:tetratricopeptide repeat protein [Ramlibacter sp.]